MKQCALVSLTFFVISAATARAADPIVVPLWSGKAPGETADLGEECGELIVLVLRPAFERVVVALIAVEAHCEEKLGRVLHDRVGFTEHLVVRSRRILER